jgi:hypothetical protein
MASAGPGNEPPPPLRDRRRRQALVLLAALVAAPAGANQVQRKDSDPLGPNHAGIPEPYPPPGAPSRGDWGPRDLLYSLGGADLVVFYPRRTAGPPVLSLHASVRAPVARLLALLSDPATYRRAVPSFRRADVLREERGEGGVSRLLAWELEVPLWNLEGKLWMRPEKGFDGRGERIVSGARFEFVEGDLAPGTFILSATENGPGSSILSILCLASMKNANWMTRKLASRHALADPAMTATAAYVLLRALVLEAERPGPQPLPQRRPTAPMAAPPARSLGAGSLAAMLLRSPYSKDHVMVAVRSRADGRLAEIEVAVPAPQPPQTLSVRLGSPAPWRALPGWKNMEEHPPPKGKPGPLIWEVDSSMPFVDFDSEWEVTRTPDFHAFIRDGDWKGAAMAVTAMPGATPTTSVAAMALHPRLDTTGYIPRKLIEAEPLLEHGLAVGLGYVDAASLIEALR